MAGDKEQQGGVNVERDENGRSEAQSDQMAGGQMSGGRQMGGGPSQSDVESPGGSSGNGGYGNMQNQQNHQGQQTQDRASSPSQSRGERFDEEQGGGRSGDTVSQSQDDANLPGYGDQGNPAGDEFLKDQQEHQDRGQSEIEDGDEEV